MSRFDPKTLPKEFHRLLAGYQRQVHLDFHTSPLIPDVGCEFDARAFARTVKRAHVNSITIFAKCHHGMCYYPTKTGTPHPALRGRDLMGEMIEALHHEGIRCPLYTTVAWEEDVAERHPEWRQVRADGTFASAVADRRCPQPGAWRFNNFLHADYQDYLEAHVRELLDGYAVDGFLFDIVFFDPESCWSDVSLKFREKHGLLGRDRATFARFQSLAQTQFMRRFARLVHSRAPRATVFFNGTMQLYVDSRIGARSRHASLTHYEIESLPSGFWGYYHFPRLARTVGHWGKPWLGMTGRFQKMWGDFGGIKPLAALEYECFRTQALGGVNSVGDQLPPRGTLEPAAYDLIGRVYVQCESAEPFYAGSKAIPQVGILLPHDPSLDQAASDKSLEGAVQMCEECHYDAAVLDDASDLDQFEMLILPDTVIVTAKLAPKLQHYYRRGGKLIASYRALPSFLPLAVAGEVDKFPTYWRARPSFCPELAGGDRVFYQPGINIVPERGTEVLVDRVLPYFRRTDAHFSSHFQTPPMAEPARHPAVIAGRDFVYFADPIFREYRQAGNLAARDAWKRAMERLIGPPPFGAGLPTTILCVPLRRGRELILTLLHYVPVRKALDIDVIEERMSFAGETLRLPPPAKTVRVFGSRQTLRRNADGSFALPSLKGRLLLEVPGFFKS